MASDFSISQFRFLERLLVVHGHWCYKRIAQMVILVNALFKILCQCFSLHVGMLAYGSKYHPSTICMCLFHILQNFKLLIGIVFIQICYFFYKNIAFGLTLFYFEAFTGFSGQAMYDDLYMLSFNVILTSLPVISLGVFEQDVSSEVCLQVSLVNYAQWYLVFFQIDHPLYLSVNYVFVVPCTVSTRSQKFVL